MHKYLKLGLIVLAGLIGILILLMAAVAITFNPNDYKPQIVKLVQEKKQRTLNLAGDIKLTFFPKLGVDLGKASLSEHRGTKEFAAVESARFYLAWWPLLHKQLVIDQVRVDGLRANLVRYKDGTTNFDDLLKKEEPSQFKFDISETKASDASLVFTDEKGGRRIAISKLKLETGRLANGKPTDISAGFNLQIDKPAVSSDVKLTSGLMFDTDAKHYVLTGLDLEAKGAAAGITNLVLGVKGDADADAAKGAYSLANLAVALTGKRGADDLDFRLTVPKFLAGQDKATAEKIGAVLKLKQPQGDLAAVFDIPAMTGTAKALQTDRLTLDVNGKQGDSGIKANLSSPFRANLDAKQFELAKLTATVNVTNPKFAGGRMNASLAGSAFADLDKQDVRLNLSTRLDESNIQAKLGMRRFDAPFYTFDVGIDRLDLDRYFPPKPAEKAQPEKPLDFSALKKLNASGSVRIGSLKAYNIRSTNVRLDVKAGNNQVEVNPLSANLYQGSTSGRIQVSTTAAPQVAVRQSLTGVSIGPLLRDAINKDMIEGRGNVSVDVATRGGTVTAMKSALQGKAALDLHDGAIKGINIASTLRNAKARLGSLKGEQVQAASPTEKTDFTELKGSFNIRDGVAHNEDLSAKSPLLRLGGAGDVDIGRDSMNYLLKATVVGTLAGQGGKELTELKGLTVPVRITGPFTALKYTLDFNALAEGMVKQKVEEKKEEVKGRMQEELQKGLKGLFK